MYLIIFYNNVYIVYNILTLKNKSKYKGCLIHKTLNLKTIGFS